GNAGTALNDAAFARLEARVAPWRQNVIHPLRAVRRWLKEQTLAAKELSDPLRRAVLGSEIESEGMQQRLMEAEVALAAGKPDWRIGAGNPARYLTWARKTTDDADLAHLALLVATGLGQCDAAAAKAELQTNLRH